MVKTLEMVFRNGSGKEVVLSLVDAKENLTLAEVKAVMQDIVANNILTKYKKTPSTFIDTTFFN